MLGSALRSALSTLRQPRYARLGALMLVVAIVCVVAGTWQIVRFEQKVAANDALRRNAHVPGVPVARVLPLVGRATPSTDAVSLRTVTATGSYDTAAQALVRGRSVAGSQGFLVLTPLLIDARTSRGTVRVLLVARGFVAATADGAPPGPIAAAPSGRVTVRGRVQAAETTPDLAGQLPDRQVKSVNPQQQQLRLGEPVYDGFVQLDAGQPGTSGLRPLPAPSLSNPAGGAVEPQHFAYIIQWYLFALLALAAPFAMARADRRELSRDGDHGEHDHGEGGEHGGPRAAPVPERAAVLAEPRIEDDAARRAVKLADRYGRAAR